MGLIVKGDGQKFPARVSFPFCDKVNVNVVKGCGGVGIIDYRHGGRCVFVNGFTRGTFVVRGRGGFAFSCSQKLGSKGGRWSRGWKGGMHDQDVALRAGEGEWAEGSQSSGDFMW